MVKDLRRKTRVSSWIPTCDPECQKETVYIKIVQSVPFLLRVVKFMQILRVGT